MGYKKMKKNLGFADFALANSLKHNRSLNCMDKLNSSLNWDRIDSTLMRHYTVGTSAEGPMLPKAQGQNSICPLSSISELNMVLQNKKSCV